MIQTAKFDEFAPSFGGEGYRLSHDHGVPDSNARKNLPVPCIFESSAAATQDAKFTFFVSLSVPPIVAPILESEKSQIKHRIALVEFLSSMQTKVCARPQMNQNSVTSAIYFLNSLERQHVTPKLMEDGEGDIILFWRDPAVLMITIEGNLLHSIVHPGRKDAVYLQTERIAEGVVLSTILKRVPRVDHSSIFSL
jgi:hypothetical protein